MASSRTRQLAHLLGGLHRDAVEGLAALQQIVVVEDNDQPPSVEGEKDDCGDQRDDQELDHVVVVGAAPVVYHAVEDPQGDEDAVGHLQEDGPDHEGKSQAAVVLAANNWHS